jgi:hypothetical protein
VEKKLHALTPELDEGQLYPLEFTPREWTLRPNG